ncbi:MAG: helix-turn-helix domain-containing protein [Phaeodactylibacter sp.]|uniref:TetR/AcrR family transcriptional regulator n=1 Tax=Phaeodactylibacter sp. TaxID=1940289 RepID=UPI0032EE5800
MARDGKPTRDKILTESRALIYENGFAGTSVDKILEKTGITKGAFFYHFKTKNHLAKSLIEEYAREDKSHLEHGLEETKSMEDRPVERLIDFVQVFIDGMSTLEEPPSCLYASYTNETSQFDQETKDLIANSILEWRKTFIDLLKQAKINEKSKIEIDIPSLADQFVVIFEGAFIVSKALNEPDLTAKQLTHLRNYIQLLLKK